MKAYKACVVSTKHERQNKPCQDYCEFMPTCDGFLAAALSDGAGSALFADFAAYTNAHAFLNFFRKYTDAGKYSLNELLDIEDEELAEDVIFYCSNALQNLAGRIGNENKKEFCATLIGIIVGENETLIFHIGDGSVFGISKNDKVQCLSAPDNIFGVSNRTYFTVDEDAIEHIRTTRIKTDDYKSFFMISDGVMPCGDLDDKSHIANIVFDKWSEGLLNDNLKLAELIDNQEAREHDDDRSIVFIEV